MTHLERGMPGSPKTRRTFLKASIMSLSAAAASRLAFPQGVHAGGNADIRIGMIGCGGRCSGAAARRWAWARTSSWSPWRTSSRTAWSRSREYFKTKFPDQFLATDDTCTYGLDGYKAVIEASDAVLIACASKYHSFYAEEAIKAGKHVFIEKPHAIDPAGCLRSARACEMAKKKNLSIVSGHESRYTLSLPGAGQADPRRGDRRRGGHPVDVPPRALSVWSRATRSSARPSTSSPTGTTSAGCRATT